jgi:hypothetical protein
MIRIGISVDNAAFGESLGGLEVARILTVLADQYAHGELTLHAQLRDCNGNLVGEALLGIEP